MLQDKRYDDMIDLSLFDIFNSTEGITKNGHEKRRNSIRSAFHSNFPIYYIFRKIFRSCGNKLHISNLCHYSGTGFGDGSSS
jgi:hypothetical protein